MEGHRLITNSHDHNFYIELKDSLLSCKSFDMSIAFINYSGLQLILDILKETEEKGIKGRVLTSNYLNFTEPKALKKLQEFSNIDSRIFLVDKKGFHTKGYMFEYQEYNKLVVGSSNLTQSALKTNVEWNLTLNSKREDFNKEILSEFDKIWNEGRVISKEFLEVYEKAKALHDRAQKNIKLQMDEYREKIEPNYMQEKALKSLDSLRKNGEDKALVIASTGSGKTYMSAFDVKQFEGKSFLFIVHREEILRDARKTFEKIGLVKSGEGTFYSGTQKKKSSKMFGMVKTVANYCEEFKEGEFDYIIIDEAHHVTASSYQKILSHFKPKFLLGMTATPERCDNGDVFDEFDDNIALDLRLREAFEHELIAPFHYFGIEDIEVDYENISLDKISEISKLLQINKRVDYIIEKMDYYSYDGDYLKGLGFCVDIEHAKYMAREFNKRGINSIALTGGNSSKERVEAIERLQGDDDTLQMIFTVDIFNEGVDIPKVNLVLMLRPTNSPIIFVQQLGRGLRKVDEKEYLTVLDFIGNHNRAFLIALALSGKRYYDKDSLKVSVKKDFIEIPGCTHIQMDKITKERILNQLENENFNTLKYLKEEYNEFKTVNKNKTPLLLDYLRYENSPNPIKFIKKGRNYLQFLKKVDKGFELDINEVSDRYYTQLSVMLPIKRPYEFAILETLLNESEVTFERLEKVLKKYLVDVDMKTLEHAIRNLNQNYLDSREKNKTKKYLEYDTDRKTIKCNDEFVESFREYNKYFLDLLHYGLIEYGEKFGKENYGDPFFKLYEQYSMVDTALLSNYEKIHSSFRGSGLITNGKEYFLFIDLHKEEDIKESIAYDDKFISNKIFQWQTPNATRQDSDRGKSIIFNEEYGVNLHIFVRKYKEIDGLVQRYIYIGKGNTVKYEGEKPITVQIKLENKIPSQLFREFILKV